MGVIGFGAVTGVIETKLVWNDNQELVVKEEIPENNVYSSSISMMLETKYNSGDYHETMDTTWKEVIEKGYVFNSTLSKCENGSILSWNDANKTVTFSGNVSDKCYVYFDKITLADYILKQYTSDGENELYKHDGLGIYGEYEAGDNSIRYAGADPNNYVCFGTDVNPCPTDNLYRIIGMFDGRIKLIKYDYATSDMLGTDGDYASVVTHGSTYKGKQSNWYRYYWNHNTSNNTWSESNLNIINLNKNYWNKLGISWQKYIDENTTWKVGGNTWASIAMQTKAKLIYQAEIKTPANEATVTAKIGLMYVSDYRYAADPRQNNSWSNLICNGYNSVASYNWMYMGEYEWTILPRSDGTSSTFHIIDSGAIYANSVAVSNYVVGVRPCFYLNSTVALNGGEGIVEKPFILIV